MPKYIADAGRECYYPAGDTSVVANPANYRDPFPAPDLLNGWLF